MNNIKAYTDRFFKKTPINNDYDLRAQELIGLSLDVKEAANNRTMDIVKEIFDYGYAKGYRACMAGQKNGGGGKRA